MQNVSQLRFDLSEEEISNLSKEEMKVFISGLQYERSQFIQEIESYASALMKDDYQVEMDLEEFQPDLQSAGNAISQTLQEVIRKISHKTSFYESILDSIPFPMSVTDMDMNWTFINRPTEQMLNVSRNDMMGKHCSNWGANICNTNECGIEILKKKKKGKIIRRF